MCYCSTDTGVCSLWCKSFQASPSHLNRMYLTPNLYLTDLQLNLRMLQLNEFSSNWPEHDGQCKSGRKKISSPCSQGILCVPWPEAETLTSFSRLLSQLSWPLTSLSWCWAVNIKEASSRSLRDLGHWQRPDQETRPASRILAQGAIGLRHKDALNALLLPLPSDVILE